MIYSKVIQTITENKNFKEKEDFVFESKNLRAQMIFSRGVHCKEVRITEIKNPKNVIRVISDLITLRDYFYREVHETN